MWLLSDPGQADSHLGPENHASWPTVLSPHGNFRQKALHLFFVSYRVFFELGTLQIDDILGFNGVGALLAR